MNFFIHTLHPEIFESFISQSLIARAVNNGVINIKTENWRELYGLGNHKQVDDKPYGGGTGMVLQPDPIYQSLLANSAVAKRYSPRSEQVQYIPRLPYNVQYYDEWLSNPKTRSKSITISLSPRGYTFNQKTAQWLADNFETTHLVCGRYEGFDSRASELFDLEISIGSYITNGGEVPAMVLIESIARLQEGFVTKHTSVTHDSFSASLNIYEEMDEFVIGSRRKRQLIDSGDKYNRLKKFNARYSDSNPFDHVEYMNSVFPFLEHPHFTRPEVWQNMSVPKILIEGNHKAIHAWRTKQNIFK